MERDSQWQPKSFDKIMVDKIIFNNRLEEASLPPIILSSLIVSKFPFPKKRAEKTSRSVAQIILRSKIVTEGNGSNDG